MRCWRSVFRRSPPITIAPFLSWSRTVRCASGLGRPWPPHPILGAPVPALSAHSAPPPPTAPSIDLALRSGRPRLASLGLLTVPPPPGFEPGTKRSKDAWATIRPGGHNAERRRRATRRRRPRIQCTQKWTRADGRIAQRETDVPSAARRLLPHYGAKPTKAGPQSRRRRAQRTPGTRSPPQTRGGRSRRAKHAAAGCMPSHALRAQNKRRGAAMQRRRDGPLRPVPLSFLTHSQRQAAARDVATAGSGLSNGAAGVSSSEACVKMLAAGIEPGTGGKKRNGQRPVPVAQRAAKKKRRRAPRVVAAKSLQQSPRHGPRPLWSKASTETNEPRRQPGMATKNAAARN